MSSTLVGLFDNSSQARNASTKLSASGIDAAWMRLSGGEPGANDGGATLSRRSNDKPGAISRFFSSLFGNDDVAAPTTQASWRNHVLLTVTLADDDSADVVSELMENCGAIEVDERIEQWRSEAYVAPSHLWPDAPAVQAPARVAAAAAQSGFGCIEAFVGRARRSGL